MLEYFYYMAFETEMINGEIKRAYHFLNKLSKGKGFYAEVAKIFKECLDEKCEPENIEKEVMKLEGDEMEKKAVYLKFLFAVNRYDVRYPVYDAKRCNDA